MTGDRDAAQRAKAQLEHLGLPLDPAVILAFYPFRNADHSAMFADGLRAAGLRN